MPPYIYVLLLHGVLGFLDIVVNHELLAKLPKRGDAAPEEALHAARETIFASLFACLAWYEWHGAWVWWIGALLLGEVIVSTRDVIVEGDTRILPTSERVVHLLMFISLGILITLVAYALVWWHGAPTAVVRVDYGWASWVLTAMAVLSFVWAVRDGVAAGRRRTIAAAS
ncbi:MULTISPECIES: hypothetical protein [unclassified Massilia]|uniref:hypothetical protein n=1 Tax=unclassified Massilia TaxID=2609279 RepID=UPI001782F370|nr:MULTISPECIES: hypothetical protein [unclassified Massilia]MBD8531753.1 hypothetical protein [Massilia sp. CFBP 13647]MBD8675198.1 hypothetical protein [Massilia sp. CFBP 13721]